MSSPWLIVLILIIVAYALIMAIRSARDLYIWYSEGREYDLVKRRAREERRQRKLEKQAMPTLKERPEEPSKASGHPIKPSERAK